MSLIIDTDQTKIIAIEVPVENILKSVNLYLVERNNKLFLIDAGYNEDVYWEHLINALHTHGYQLNDLDAILLTHHHIDHVGLVYRLKETFNLPVYVHPLAVPKLTRDPKYLYMYYQLFKDLYVKLDTGSFGDKEIDRLYEKQMAVDTSAIGWNFREIHKEKIFDFEVIYIPGHASDQIAFYLADEDILFGADLLIEHQAVSAFIEPSFQGERENVLKQHITSLEKVIQLNPKLLLSGHGPQIEHAAALAQKRINGIEKKSESFLKLVKNGFPTVKTMVKERHPVRYEKIFHTIMRDALSFLDYLEEAGKVQKKEIDGVWHYSVREFTTNE